MNDPIDIAILAAELADIARTTSDPETGRKLMGLVERVLRALGLPPAGL